MNPFKILPTVLMSTVPVFGVFAGEPATPPATPPAAPAADADKRVRELEARVQQLEDILRERGIDPNNPNQGPQQFGRRQPFGAQRFGGRDPQDIFEQMRREMERHFGNLDDEDAFGWSFGGGIPPEMVPNRPRLGVEMRAVSDEMVERYKNSVKEGVFIVSVVPNSPAERAGLRVGDAVTVFDGKPIKQPSDLLEAVQTAQPGKKELSVLRRGETVALSVDLGDTVAEAPAPANRADRGGWLRRGDLENDANGNVGAKQNRTSRTEVRASALESSDALAAELKLTDEQKKKMGEVLAKHRQALNEEVSNTHTTRMNRRGAIVGMSGDMSRMVEKHAKDAETELAGTLSPDQIAKWGEWRKRNNSVSVNQTMSFDSTTAPGGRSPGPDNAGF